MASTFEIVVTAEVAQLQKGFADATKQSNQFASSLNKSVGNAATQVQKSTGSATNSIVNFGRILQDSAYGPQGFANNLNPFFEGLSRVREESKLTGKSVTSLLVSSLAGAGGLSLAISAVTAALSFAAVGLQFYGRKTKDAKKETDDYVSSLGDVARASLIGAQAAVSESTKLALVYRAATDAAAGTKLRSDAIRELQTQYPAYFKNISAETIAAGGAKKAYDQLAASILAAARARAATDIITKNASRQLEDDQKINDLLIERDKLTARIAKNRIFLDQNSSALGAGVGASNTEGIVRNIASIEAERAKIQKQINDLTTDHTKLNARNLDLTEKIYQAAKDTQSVSVLTGNQGGVGDLAKQIKEITTRGGNLTGGSTTGIIGPIVTESDLQTVNDTVTATGNLEKALTDSYLFGQIPNTALISC